MNMKLVLVPVVAVVSATGLLAAARQDQPVPDPPMMEFAACMRSHGEDVADPIPNGRGSFTVQDPPSVTPEQISAHDACDPILRAVTPPQKWASVHSPSAPPAGGTK
jgi:hypothetical protein